MNAQELEALGFTITAGQIDRANVNYGHLTPTGALLTPEGELLVLALRTAAAPVVPGEELEDAGAPRKPGRPRKTQE